MKTVYGLLVFLLLINSAVFSQWNIVYTPSTSQTVMTMKFWDANTGYHAGVLYNSSTMNIHKTTNGGLNYVQQSSGWTAQRFMTTWLLSPDTVLMAGNYGKIIKTVNGGNNWVTVYADTTLQFWGLWFTTPQTGFIAGSGGTIMKTTNRGENWVNIASPTITALDGIWFVNESTGYIGGANVFLKTTNGGVNWVNKTGLFISGFETATSIYFSDANTGVYGTNASRIVRTTDGGETYTEVFNSSNNAIWGLSFVNANTGYGCTSGGSVVKTTNGGVNWGFQNTPLTENLYEIHFPSVNTGYAASWSGKILKTTNGGLTFIGETGTGVSKDYKLEQNYPNPFNPGTVIRYRLPAAGNVLLKVYDVHGREIRTLINERLQPGSYETKFDGSLLSTGVYFYKIIINGETTKQTFSETKRMLLIK
ncbi:MAG: T9SS type A sorting domain-containing protein [Ignavibacteria bacterium]